MTIEKNQSSAFVRFLGSVVRLILSIIIGLLIGAGLYFGFQYVYQQVVTSIEQNTAAIQNLDTRVNQQWELLNEKNTDIEDRLTMLENNQDTLLNQIAEMKVQVDQTAADLDAFELKYNNLVEKFEVIDKAILELTKQDSEFAAQNEKFQIALDDLDVEKQIQPLQQDVAIFKIMLQINRSRSFLIQDNLGLAKDELLLAQDMMNSLLSLSSPQLEEEILVWNARLELAIDHLPNNPILANDDLEILWTMMAKGLDESNQFMDLESTEELDEN